MGSGSGGWVVAGAASMHSEFMLTLSNIQMGESLDIRVQRVQVGNGGACSRRMLYAQNQGHRSEYNSINKIHDSGSDVTQVSETSTIIQMSLKTNGDSRTHMYVCMVLNPIVL